MHSFRLVALFAALCVASILCKADSITVQADNRMPKGWMSGGWGNYRFVIKNDSDGDATIVKWTAHWEANGKTMEDAWGGDLNQPLPAGKSVTRDETGYFPPNVAKAAKPHAAVMVGSFTIRTSKGDEILPYRVEVPEAVLPEPLKLVKGKTVGLDLMVSRYAQFKHLDRTLKWIDECYSAMIDLTGEKPFGGKLMVFKECPPHPWWAYAGQEMILNTDYVGSTLTDFDDGLISFGWVHEVGHNFDVLGDWYIWSGPAAEWQANFKLCYAFESIEDRSFRIKWTFQAPGYPSNDKEERLEGRDFVELFFSVFGDAYLADPKRTWDTLSSDEMHTFFQRIQQVYGWDVYKRWYRTYRKLADAGMKPPETPEDKVNLIAAILSRETRTDLIPVFQRWRFPVALERVNAMRQKYGIEQPAVAQ